MAAAKLTPDEAAALLRPTDTLGIPLGPGQPPAFLEALGRRDDWIELRIGGALLLAWSEASKHPERPPTSRGSSARSSGRCATRAPTSASPRRLPPLRAAARAAATAGDGDRRDAPRRGGWCSLSLHAGGTHVASSHGPAPTPTGCSSSRSRRASRAPRPPTEHRHALHVDQIDVLVESEAPPFALPDPPPDRSTRRSRRTRRVHPRRRHAADRDRRRALGDRRPARRRATAATTAFHSEMFTDGLMKLHERAR